MKTRRLTDIEMTFIRGGGGPVKPITPPRDRFDEEEQAQVATLSGADHAQLWREWLKKWLSKNK